jgi:hypothetical protein
MWNPTRYFRSSGIFTKLADGGDPAYVTRVGMLAAVSAHVAPKTSVEKEFMARSAFASFSTSRERAMYYARGRYGRQLVVSARLDHEVVLFKMDVSQRIPDRTPGTYVLKYDCDDSIREPDFQEDMDLVRDGWGLAGGCEFCKDGRRPHTLFLIDVAEYVRAQPSHSRDEDALENARADEEWLALPIDHIERLRGDAAHIPRSAIWTYETFKSA